MSQHEAYLKQQLVKYQHSDKCKQDVIQALNIYTDLRPQKGNFVFNDGRREDLVSVEGTIPVSYKGVTYNIPICIWLLSTHPYNPPMCFVRPTATMQIKASKHVDVNGRVYLPYLHEWRYPNSDLLGLIELLIIIFSEEPPVFSKSSQQNPIRQPPAYPSQAGFMPMPGGQPGYPGYPPSGAQPPYPPTSGYPGSNYPPTSSAYPPTPAYPTYQQPTSNANPGTYPPYPSFDQNQQNTESATSAGNTGTVNEEQLRDSLISAVEDKMKRRLREIFAQAQAEMDALKNTKEDLERGKSTLDDMMQKMSNESTRLDDSIITLRQRIEDAKQNVHRLNEQGSMDVDDAVMATTPLYRQIFSTFAEDNATEDAIYFLGEALRKGAIDLDVYLKHVRELSRQQFLLRALMFKARSKAGLPELSA